MGLINKLTKIADGFRSSNNITKKLTIDEMIELSKQKKKQPNGTEWVKCSTMPCVDVFYADHLWVTCGINGIYYSLDGKTWNEGNIVDTINSYYIGCTVYNDNNIWVVGGENFFFYSNDGKNWNVSETVINGYINKVFYKNNIWCAATDTGIYYSFDGKTWNLSNMVNNHVNHIYNNGSIWVAARK